MSFDDRELASRFGSPLYVYDGDLIVRQHRTLVEALPEDASVHYAVKANPSLGVLALLRSLGAGAEVASQGELLATQRAGFPASRVLWAGPAKTDADHEAAAAAGIAAIHAESDGELRRIDALGRRLGRRIDVGARVHVPWGAGETTRIIGGGEATKFGIPESDARRLAPSWARLEGVRVRSVHVFNASNVRDAGALVASARATLRLGADLAAMGLPIEVVDVGGGLGVPMTDDETPLDVAALGSGLREALADLKRGHDFAPRLAMEPGRFLVAEAGRYLMTVVDVKRHGDVEFVACDGGIHHLLRPALVGQPHPIECWTVAQDARRRRRRVVGPLCTSLDDLGSHELPDVSPGDVLRVTRAGAYGFTESMPMFLSHARPAEVMLLGGEAHLLRPRLEPERWLEGQEVPPTLSSSYRPGTARTIRS